MPVHRVFNPTQVSNRIARFKRHLPQFVSGILLLSLLGSCQQSTPPQPTAHSLLELDYQIHLPDALPPAEGWPILVAVHGINGDADQACGVWTAIAHQYNYLLVCPSFVDRYWTLENGEDVALDRLLEEIANTHPVQLPIYLTGISAGGRFTHRYTFAHPQKVQAAAITADASEQSFQPGAQTVPLFIAMGAKDEPWAPKLMPMVEDLQAQGFQVSWYLSPDAGHEWSGDIVQATIAFFDQIQHSLPSSNKQSESSGQIHPSIARRIDLMGMQEPMREEKDLFQVSQRNLMVALVFGQSNSANYGETRHQSQPQILNFYDGKVYTAVDPLLGADGTGGSVWTRLGDKLIASGLYETVIFVSIGVGGTEIARWAPEGDLHSRILKAIVDTQNAGLEITHLFWHQGESDAYTLNTARETYQQHFQQMLASIRNRGVSAPIYVCVATRFAEMPRHAEIRAAQLGLVNNEDIFLGPDTDPLGHEYRYDGAHFSTKGLEKFADLWKDILVLHAHL